MVHKAIAAVSTILSHNLSSISQAPLVFQKQHQVVMSTGFLLTEWGLFVTSFFDVDSILQNIG